MRLAIRGGRAIAIIVAIAAPSCGMAGPSPDGGTAVKAGQWGGTHIAMTVAADRTDIEFDCAKASIIGSLDTDRDGAFVAAGTFQPERPGPTTPEEPAPRRMRLSGTVKGDDMQVSVRLTDQNEDIGVFTLTFGAAPRLFKCR
jgi:hypothetical protein